MLFTPVLILPLLVTSSLGNCGGGRWPSHVYQERTEVLEDDEVISRDNTTFEVTKNDKETIVEQITSGGTTFDDSENEGAEKEQSVPENSEWDSEDDALQSSFDEDVGEGFESLSGILTDDDDEYVDMSEMDDWTKHHYKKIKGLRLLQNVTQDLVLPQSGKHVCWANVCHELDVVLHRVDIVAPPGVTIRCLDGGVGSYKMVFEIIGRPGLSGVMSGKMWGVYAHGHRYIWVTSGDWAYQCGESVAHC